MLMLAEGRGRWAVSQQPKLLIRYKCFPFVLFSVTGCLNGGGQIRPGDGETSKELLSRLDELYTSLRYQLLFVFPFVIALLSLGHSNFSSSDPLLLSALEVL